MKAALMHAFAAPLEITTVPDPDPPADGVVIEVRANGICRSDWHAWMGHDDTVRLPHVPGHELAGVVVETGPGAHAFAVGERVTVPFCCGCGSCTPCREGHQNLCEREYQPGFDGWGAFAQYVAIPHADVNLVRLPAEMDFVEAASLGCRFMTSFHGLVDLARLQAGEWLAVHGCGGVGLSAVMIGAALGAAVIAVDIDDGKLELARRLGASATVNAARDDAVAAVRQLSGGGVAVSVDALGSAATCVASLRSLRRRGRHLQIGLLLGGEAHVEVPMAEVIKRELVVLGSHGMQAHRYGDALRMVASGRIEPARLLGKTVSLEEAGAELEAMGRFAGRGVTVIDRF